MLIAQITDCHVVREGEFMADRVDSSLGLVAVIDAINRLDPQPVLVVGTGDLVNSAEPAQYDRLEELLSQLAAPFVPLPGNHDDRAELRRRFPALPAGSPDEPIDHVIDIEALRIICLDTSIPGHNPGRLTSDQCTWLDGRLADQPGRPTIVFQHHPPFRSGIPFMDTECGFSGADDEAAVIGRHPQVQLVSCGHYHRSITRRFGGTVAACWPSTAVQLELDSNAGPPLYRTDPVGFALHSLDSDGGLTSHLMPVTDADVWIPSWAR